MCRVFYASERFEYVSLNSVVVVVVENIMRHCLLRLCDNNARRRSVSLERRVRRTTNGPGNNESFPENRNGPKTLRESDRPASCRYKTHAHGISSPPTNTRVPRTRSTDKIGSRRTLRTRTRYTFTLTV